MAGTAPGFQETPDVVDVVVINAEEFLTADELALYKENRMEVEDRMREIAAKIPNGHAFEIQGKFGRETFVLDPEAATYVIEHEEELGLVRTFLLDALKRFIGYGILTANASQEKKDLRAQVEPSFSRQAIVANSPKYVDNSLNAMQVLDAGNFNVPDEAGVSRFNPKLMIYMLGKNNVDGTISLSNMIDGGLALLELLKAREILTGEPDPLVEKFTFEQLKGMVTGQIDAAIEYYIHNQIYSGDMLGDLIGQFTQNGAVELDDRKRQVLYAHIEHLYPAAIETTAQTVSLFLFFLSQRPELIEMIRAEADKIDFLNFKPSDLDNMETIENIVKELLRLEPVAPDSGRTASRDEVAEYKKDGKTYRLPLKQGQIVRSTIRGINMNPEEFEAPHEFKLNRPKKRDMTFLTGKMSLCIGVNLAPISIAILLAVLLKLYNVEFTGDPNFKRTTINDINEPLKPLLFKVSKRMDLPQPVKSPAES
jgi:hypothetical protein